MSTEVVQITVQTAQNLGLTPQEFEKIKQIMGRTPNFTELSIYAVMWSEHCSYKNSILWLKTLPRDGGRLLVGAGEENAGLVDIGNGLACAFKIESHNHPSAIEPYQGAATGVGGIHRDIFTMGARPIAAMNSLRFGDPNLPHTRHLVEGVVAGIGDYGNCFGVPTVGGEVYFNDCYNQNILVNAFSAGVVKVGETVSASADGPGNTVFIVGSSTGKDGIHGATFASADLTEDSVDDLPSVQVGDPFQEKLLLEASLEVIKTGAVVGMQDMGAAGITCSSSEMSAKSKTGMLIDLDKVPTRQDHMKPFEILLSESQERMLVVVEKGKEALVQAVFDKWDLECAEIGVVTDTGRVQFLEKGEIVADVDADSLVLGGGAPVYKRKSKEPEYLKKIKSFNPESIPVPDDFVATAKTLFESPNLVSKRWVYEQYDSMVRTNSVSSNQPADASIIRIKGTKKALALTVDCNATYVFADPYKGTMIAVAEAARNIVCSGGKPLAITNCLNFGNPYNEEVFWQFSQAIKGMGDACRKFDTPVTGGNVSFYNQTVLEDSVEPVHPTPTIGMMGLLNDVDEKMTLFFKNEGDVIFALGNLRDDIASSEYIKSLHQVAYSPAPYFDLDEAYDFLQKIAQLLGTSKVLSLHDVSEGGLFTTLMEASMVGNFGFSIKSVPDIRKDAFLFGESQSRVIMSCSLANAKEILYFCEKIGLPIVELGTVTRGNIEIDGEDFGSIVKWKKVHENTLGEIMNE